MKPLRWKSARETGSIRAETAASKAKSTFFICGVSTIGIVRARCKIGMTNLVYNKGRFVCLESMAAAVNSRDPTRGAPVHPAI
jgi:hypothetical protein